MPLTCRHEFGAVRFIVERQKSLRDIGGAHRVECLHIAPAGRAKRSKTIAVDYGLAEAQGLSDRQGEAL